jgi:hypothetical protein
MTETRETWVLSRLYLWLGVAQALVALFFAAEAFVNASGHASVLATMATVLFGFAGAALMLSAIGLVVAGIGKAREARG